MYKFDTHVHTSETSICGMLTGAQTAELYHNEGYFGICITDHYYKPFFSKLDGDWNYKIDRFLEGYKSALTASADINIKVMLGLEMRLEGSSNEYLIYGVTEEFLKNNPKLYELDLQSLHSLVKKENLLMYQAHPFRPNMTPADPSLIDGIEVYNGNPRQNSRNTDAYEYAKKHGLKMLSGSDCHQIEDVARGGISTNAEIFTNEDFTKMIRTGNYELITSDA